jgi:hypothetical protein
MDSRVVPPGVTWHSPQAAGQDAAVGPDGRMPLTEVTYDKAGAASPFGEEVAFPMPQTELNYQHPSDDDTASPLTTPPRASAMITVAEARGVSRRVAAR